MFLEIKGIKKHFGEGDSRIEVLKGIDMEIEKGELVGELTVQTAAILQLMAKRQPIWTKRR